MFTPVLEQGERVKTVSRPILVMLLIILAAAAGFRFWGLSWGLPTAQHYFSYHPDETLVLMAALRVSFLEGQLDPGFYNYGSLYIYLVNIAVFLASICGAINPGGDDILASIGEFAKMYTAGRIMAVLLGIATVYLAYALGRRMYGQAAGLLAAGFMAVVPLHVMHSKFLAVDVPATFFVTLSLLFATRIPDGRRARDYILSGLFAGLAAATKYNAGVVLLAPVAAHLAGRKGKSVGWTSGFKVLGTMAGAGVGFLIGCPGALLYSKAFVRDFTYEMLHARAGHGVLFMKTGSGFVYHLTSSLWSGMGVPLLALAAVGLLYAIRKRTAHDWVLLAFLIPYYVLIGSAQVRFARYTMPLLPVMALLAARVSVDTISRLWQSRLGKVCVPVAVLVLTLVIGYTMLYSAALDNLFAARDTRDQAAAWIEDNIPTGTSIGLPTVPWFYTPPISPYFGHPDPRQRYEAAQEVDDYVLVVSGDREFEASLLIETAPDYVILSKFEYEDRLRIGDPAAKEYFRILRRDYRPAKEFEGTVAIFGRAFPTFGELPHDMSYASPTIRMFSLRIE